jgi:hypothetical protein
MIDLTRFGYPVLLILYHKADLVALLQCDMLLACTNSRVLEEDDRPLPRSQEKHLMCLRGN